MGVDIFPDQLLVNVEKGESSRDLVQKAALDYISNRFPGKVMGAVGELQENANRYNPEVAYKCARVMRDFACALSCCTYGRDLKNPTDLSYLSSTSQRIWNNIYSLDDPHSLRSRLYNRFPEYASTFVEQFIVVQYPPLL